MIAENINEGLAAAGRILNSVLGEKKATLDEVKDVLDLFTEDEEGAAYTIEPGPDENSFIVYNESEISKDCNDGGESKNWREESSIPQYNISGKNQLIIA